MKKRNGKNYSYFGDSRMVRLSKVNFKNNSARLSHLNFGRIFENDERDGERHRSAKNRNRVNGHCDGLRNDDFVVDEVFADQPHEVLEVET